MSDKSSDGRQVATVKTMFDILKHIREKDGLSALELSEELGLARSTVHDHLTTLRNRSFVVNDGGTYYVGLKFLDYGQYARSRHEICEIVQPTLEQLAEETGELVWFGIEEHGKFVHLNEAVGERAVSVAQWVGERRYLHTQAVGKAILAHLSPDYVDKIIEEQGLPSQTEHTITDYDELQAELEQIREDNVAFNHQEFNVGVRAVGAPVIFKGDILGALSVSGPANRLSGDYFEKELPKMLKASANEIELKWTSHVK